MLSGESQKIALISCLMLMNIYAYVDKIVVHRTIRPAPGQRTRQIEVHLNFIGQFSIPSKGMENKNE